MYSQCFWRGPSSPATTVIVPMFEDSTRICCDRHRLVGVLVRVGEHVVGELLAPRHDEVRVGRDGALVEAAGDRDHLGDRARLVGVDRREVAGRDLDGAVVVDGRTDAIASTRRCAVSITTTVPRLGAELADALEQRLLDGELDRAVEREDDVVAGDRLLGDCSLPGIERPPGATSLRHLARPWMPVSSRRRTAARARRCRRRRCRSPITLRRSRRRAARAGPRGSTLTPVSSRLAICVAERDVDLALDVHEALVLGRRRRAARRPALVGEAEHGRERLHRAAGSCRPASG